jgi:hypothetical protein
MAVLKRVFNDITWEQMLRQTPIENRLLLCERLPLKETWDASGQEPSVFLEAYFLDRPEIFLMMLSEEHLDVLLQIWNPRQALDLDSSEKRVLPGLENLGFIRYDHKNKILIVNEEAKDNFYFLLKSRSSAKKNRLYQKIEFAVKGILYQCGIIEMTQMYDMISKEVEIDYPEFWQYLTCRMTFWYFLRFMRNRDNGEIYVISYEVRDYDQVFCDWNITSSKEFRPLFLEEAVALGEMTGIGSWKGTSELLAFCLDELFEDDVMASTVFAKTILLDIQNGEKLEEIQKRLKRKMSDFSEQEKEMVYDCLKDMYWHTPLYALKGYSRYEREEEERQFFVIDGGKSDEENI